MVRLVGVFNLEAECTVQAHGGFVGGIDVQHCSLRAGGMEVLQASNGEGFTETVTVKVRVHRNHVDLARDHWSRMQLRPAERGQSAVAFVQEKALSVEP